MQGKKPISLMVFGILVIACGLFILYTFVLYLLNKPWIALDFDFGQLDSWSYLSSLIYAPGLVVGFIVSGIGVLKAKPWSRYLLLTTTGVALWGLVNRMIVLGPCTEETFYLSRFFIGGLFIWFFNRKSLRTVFPYRKGLKILTVLWIIVLSLELGGAGILWFKYGGRRILKLQKGVYQTQDESFYSKDYIRSPFPLEYTLAIPRGFTPAFIDKNKVIGTEIFLSSPKKGLISMGDPRLLQRMYSSAKLFGYRNPYRYYEKFYSERYGLYFMMLRILDVPMGIGRIEKAQVDGLRAFIYRGERKEKVSCHFYLFRGGEAIGHGSIILRDFTRQQVDDIISSIKPQDKPLKSAEDFFREGKELFSRHYLEKAKFSFISALYLDWGNPQYHYHLGRTLFETKNWSSAKIHLEKAITFQPDYPEAHKLLREVKILREREIGKI